LASELIENTTTGGNHLIPSCYGFSNQVAEIRIFCSVNNLTITSFHFGTVNCTRYPCWQSPPVTSPTIRLSLCTTSQRDPFHSSRIGIGNVSERREASICRAWISGDDPSSNSPSNTSR